MHLGELLTTKEIAGYLKLRPETVLRKVKEGEIPAIRVGGRFRFDTNEIDGWLRRRSTSRRHVLIVDDETVRPIFKQTPESEVTVTENGAGEDILL
jgi:excisionase family DNA binding protein